MIHIPPILRLSSITFANIYHYLAVYITFFWDSTLRSSDALSFKTCATYLCGDITFLFSSLIAKRYSLVSCLHIRFDKVNMTIKEERFAVSVSIDNAKRALHFVQVEVLYHICNYCKLSIRIVTQCFHLKQRIFWLKFF